MSSLARAYSVLHVKSVDAQQRVFSGMASTPEVDRMGDVIEPKGATFKNPLSLLLHHKHDLPVGTVTFGKPTEAGIPFEATIPDVSEPGTLKSRVDEAWQSVKHGLIRGVSVGFRTLDDGIELMRSGGYRFTKIEVLELSLVAVPANAGAVITTVKSLKELDAPFLAALGTGQDGITQRSGASDAPPKQARKDARPMKIISDQIKEYEASRETKRERMSALMTKAAEGGVTLDEAESEEYETLAREVDSVNTHIQRLTSLDEMNKRTAVPVAKASNPTEASAARGGHVVSVSEPKMDAGIAFARSVMCELQARMDHRDVITVAKMRYPSHQSLHKFLETKATVPAGTTTDTVYALPLVNAQNITSEFIEFLRPSTIIGKFGTNGIPSLTRVPFNVRVPRQTSGGNAAWVGEGVGKPLTSVAFDTVTLTHDKVATIAVLTKEVVRLSSPSAEEMVRNSLRDAVVQRIDTDFIHPGNAGTANVKPASITYGVAPLTSVGTSSDNVITDVGKLIKAYVENNMNPSGLVLIMPATMATMLGMMRNSLGQRVFDGVNMNGGTLEGIPVITTQYAANQSGAGNLVIAVHAPSILLADDGVVTVDASDQVSLQMSDAPTINAVTGVGASLVSMWQTNSLAVRAEREITWVKGRSEAVVFIDDTNWGTTGSPA
jgi:HK97 family phage major capsid protein/HK97 family phage prohead protease